MIESEDQAWTIKVIARSRIRMIGFRRVRRKWYRPFGKLAAVLDVPAGDPVARQEVWLETGDDLTLSRTANALMEGQNAP
jgi:hypothetical protein